MSARILHAGLFLAVAGFSGLASGQGLPPHTRLYTDLRYGKYGAGNLLDVCVPTNARSPVPLVIWVHGGGWRSGAKGGSPVMVLVDKGFAVASINYRLSDAATFPAQIQDCKAAVRYLRGNAKRFNLDPDRFGVWGESAGGHLVALLGTSAGQKELEGTVGSYPKVSSQVQAVCDWCGPTDLERFMGYQAVGSGFPADTPNLLVSKLLGGPVGTRTDLARMANPITFVTDKCPPFLIMHGDADRLVPLEQSRLLDKALRDAGAEVTLHVVPGAGHGKFNDRASLQLVEGFFNKTLRKSDGPKGAKADEPARSVATVSHQSAGRPAGTLELFSNGRIGSPEGIHTWSLEGNTLVFCWYTPDAPKGVWVDTCVLSRDGQSYRGRNQVGVAITGQKTGGRLRGGAKP